MKKLLMVIGLAVVLAPCVFAQAGKTNYYKYIETVNTETGVRSNDNRKGIYITFTRNSCYESDDKGIQAKIAGSPVPVYIYEGEQNNLLVFKYKEDSNAGTYSAGMFVDVLTYTFSKDYKRLNTNDKRVLLPQFSKFVYIYELADPPSKGPATLY
jgi:hypothetical protein